MPIYKMQGPNGTVYSIEGPPNASHEQVVDAIMHYYPEASGKEPENALEKSGWLGDLAASAADIPLSFVGGLAGTGKTFTDVFGAGNVASRGLDYVTQLASELKSSEARQDAKTAALIQQEAEGKGIWEEVVAAAKAFTYSPLETTASLTGSAVPFIAGAVASGGSAVPVMLGMGALSGAGTIKGDIYDAMYETSLKHGANEEQARAAAEQAQSYGGGNLDQITLGAVFGAAASATGMPRQIASAIGREAAETVAENVVRKSVLKGTLKGAVEEALPEAAQAGQERYAQNIAQQRAGYEVDPWAGVAGQAAFEGIASLLPGAYGGRRETRAANRDAVEQTVTETAAAFTEAPTEEVATAAIQRFIDLGFQPDEAQKVVANIASKTQDLQERAAAEQQAQEERQAAQPVDEEALFAEPDITQPMPSMGEELTAPPVDEEEQAAMQQFYEQGEPYTQMGGPAPQGPVSTAPSEVSPEQATYILNDDTALQQYADYKGIDVSEAEDQLTSVVEGVGNVRYSRRGRPSKDQRAQMEQAGQESLFGGMPTQMEIARNKREELIQQKLDIAPEERANLLTQNLAAAEQRMAEATRRNEEANAAKLEEITQAVRSAHPANEAYQVTYTPDTAKPYQVRGPDGELFVAEESLPKFEEAVSELLPYTPAPESVQAVDEGGFEPTVATSMLQELTKDIDAARNAGKIDNNQRSQLLNQIASIAGRTYKGEQDDLTKLEDKARAAASEFRNARGLEAKAAEIKLADANDKLRKFVQRNISNPTQSRLKSMSENRQLEREGATIRAGSAKVQQRLGEMEGKSTTAEQTEQREAKIDIAETKVTKFKRGEAKRTGVRASVVQRVADAVTSQWKSKNPVTVVQSIKDIADKKLKAAIKRDGATDAKGLVAPDGTVYLIADNIDSEAEAKATLFHEGLGHIGLEKLFRGALDDVLTSLYRGNAALKADVDKWRGDNPKAYAADANPLARAVEEVLAERSEDGPLERSLVQRIAAVVRDFARRLGFKLAISDNDVAAILRMAHDQTINGPQESTTVKGMRYAGFRFIPEALRPKVSPKTKTKLEELDASTSTAARRMAKSIDVNGLNNGLSDAIKAHNGEGVMEWMKDNYKSVSEPFFKQFLRTLLTSDILKSFGKDFTTSADNENLLATIDTAVHRMSSMRTNISRESDKLHRRISKHMEDHGNTAMAEAMGTARITGISPDEFDSVEKALTDHGAMKELTKRILANSNDKAKTQAALDQIKQTVTGRKDRVTVRGDKTTESAAMLAAARTLAASAKDAKESNHRAEQLAELTRRIRDSYAAGEVLKAQKGGMQLYKDLRAFYKDMYEAELALLDERINKTLDQTQATRLRDRRAEMMRDILSPDKRRKAGDMFYDMDADLFSKDYFPFMREGKYWLRVEGSKDGTREREFYTFYTAGERQAAMRRVAKRLGLDLNAEGTGDIIQTGNNIEELQKHIKDSDEMMRLVFDTVEKARAEIKAGSSKDIDDLYNDITQVWLQSTPERAMRRRMMHADEVVGMSQDILTHFQTQASLYANQLSKMMYAHDIRMKVETLQELIKGKPPAEQVRLRMIAAEIGTRVEDEINPRTQSALVNALNRASYVYYLTSAATAMVQATTIPIRVMSRLWVDYGFAKSNLMGLKYLRVWKSLGKPKTQVMHPSVSDELHAMIPTIKDSDLINKGDPARVRRMQYARQQGMARNTLETVSDTLLQNERSAPVSKSTGVVAAIKGASLETVKIAGVAFTGMENLTRQATYFMTFELAYDKYKADNPKATEQEAMDHAVDKAMNTVRDTNGDFTSWERPSLTKNEWTRALFLFKMYPLIQTSWFVRSTSHIIKGMWPGSSAEAKAQRNYAMKEMMGVTMMAGMFGGLVGLPLYSLMTFLWASVAGPDGDDEDIKEMIATGADPRTAYDPDLMFKGWLMDRFGTPEVNDKDFADILINGPVSVLSDTDVGSRTSLDLKNMWFREAIAGDTAAMTILKTLVANFAGGQMLVNWIDAIDALSEGDTRGFITKGLPAFAKAPATAAYNANMGVTDRKGNVIIAKEKLTELDAVRSLLGFRPMSLARHQDYVITRAKGEKEIEGERNDIFNRMNKAIFNGEMKTREDFLKFWEEEVVPFNRTYPDPDLVIEEGDLIKSYKGTAQRRALTVQGMQVNKKTGEANLRAASKFMIEDPLKK